MTALLIAAALAFSAGDAHLALETARTLVEKHTPRNGGTVESRRAAEFIASEARKLGAKVTIDPFEAMSAGARRTFTNVYAEFERKEPPQHRGEDRVAASDDWTVVVSHFDTKHGIDCPGANDGAATTGLLVGLAQARQRCGGGNLMLVWTDGEECVREYGPEDGFQGSKRAADVLAKSGRRVHAVIVADMLGDRDLSISVPLNSSERLRNAAIAAARKIGEPGLVKTLDGRVLDDHVPFLEKGFAAIDLIDFSYGPDNAWWHTREDTMDKISERSLLKSGRFIGEMIGGRSETTRRASASTNWSRWQTVDAVAHRVTQWRASASTNWSRWQTVDAVAHRVTQKLYHP